MMTATDPIAATGPQSRKSTFMMVARFYMPRLKWVMIVYPIVSLLCAAFMVFTAYHGLGFFGLMIEWLPCLMIIFAPLAFARYSAREVDIALPASWQVKAAFMLIFTLVIVPLLVLLLPALSQTGRFSVFDSFISAHDGSAVIVDLLPGWLITLQRTQLATWINSLVPSVLCLLFVLSFRRDTILKSVLWSFGAGVVYMIIQTAVSAFMIFYRIINELDIINGNEPSNADIEAITQQTMMEYLHYAYGLGFPLLLVIGALLCCLVCRKVKNRNC